jgi:hypothetical protein
MYYKEEIINGILCFKTYPNDNWKPVGEKELTKRVTELKAKVALLELELEMKVNGE